MNVGKCWKRWQQIVVLTSTKNQSILQFSVGAILITFIGIFVNSGLKKNCCCRYKIKFPSEAAIDKGGASRELYTGRQGLKDAMSGLRRQLSATESLLKMMRNAFYFTLKSLFVLEIFTFLSWLFSREEKGLDQKDIVNFTFYDVITWLTNNRNAHIAHYLEK